ncbi:hypothetical protein OH492_25355 [Vibrio chagasii]|nr:hypothetical protein [Vibrio chagasii]
MRCDLHGANRHTAGPYGTSTSAPSMACGRTRNNDRTQRSRAGRRGYVNGNLRQ